MIRLAVAGAAGRMGIRIIKALQGHDKAQLTAGFEAPGHPLLGKPLAEVCGCAGLEAVLEDNPVAALAKADVLIDFTAPQPTLDHLAEAAKAGKACVIGTTGLDQAQQQELRALALGIPVVFAPNMSVGMNLMFKLVGMIAKVLGPDYALELMEAHHDQKKDAPSGTAVRLLEELAQAHGWDLEQACRHGRKGIVGARTKEEIGVSVVRGGDVVGEHTVYFIGQGERLELTHRAHSRDTFVQGALRAALWVVEQRPGLYDMQDVLGLRD
ncbi:MAG: 4-hydroxy-tetrahydrodipicolinate reductase [Desulfarculaceae bacterium]|jgi:4-hydroxy-tetrahydrodipicolinate reductase